MPASPSTDQILDRLREALDRFGYRMTIDDLTVVDRWEKRRSGSTFVRVTAPLLPTDLVCKVDPHWEPGASERVYQASRELREILALGGLGEDRSPAPVAWTENPEMLVMTYIEGTDVVSILRDPQHGAWADEARLLRSWMSEAGAMLAAFHERAQADADASAAGADVRTLCRRLRLGGRTSATLHELMAVPGRAAASYGDFGPGNLMAGDDGVVRLIDPPTRPRFAPVHRDLAHFLFETTRQLAGHGYTRTRPVRGWTRTLRRAFLEGYSDNASGGPLTPADYALIHAYETRRSLGMAHKSWRRRPGDAAWAAGLAARLRVAVSRDLQRTGAQPSV